MDRREFTKGILATATSFALLESLFAFDAFGTKIKPVTDQWALKLNEYCADLNTKSITPLQWQERIEELYSKINLAELLKFIDFENLRKGFRFPELGVATKPVKFPSLDGLPEKTIFVKKIFGMKKDRAIIPHGHSNMASAHLILKGELHIRQYEKIEQNSKSLIIKPSIDRNIRAGEFSSISDKLNNVHWFIANTESAFTFDVIMLDLNERKYDIHNLDIFEAEDLKNGTLRVPVLEVRSALEKYGKQHH